jgi:hypothetical protein
VRLVVAPTLLVPPRLRLCHSHLQDGMVLAETVPTGLR